MKKRGEGWRGEDGGGAERWEGKTANEDEEPKGGGADELRNAAGKIVKMGVEGRVERKNWWLS